jgi:hypothetical protein
VAGCSPTALVTTDGRLLHEDPEAVGDHGQGMEFLWTSGNLRPEQLMAGHTLLRAIGIVGTHEGEHQLRVRIDSPGSPLWAEEWTWDPADDTWLTLGDDYADLTPAQVDALTPMDRSGAYVFHKRTARQSCQFFRVEVSTVNADSPTYVPYELSLELGSRGGLGRTPVNTFTTTIGR